MASGPETMVAPMDDPDAGIHSGAGSPALRRSTEAIRSGCVIDIAGLPVGLAADDDVRATAMAALLRGLRPHSGAAVLELSFDLDPPRLPERAPDGVYDDVEAWRLPGRLWLRHSSGVVARADETEIRLGGGRGDLQYAFRRLFQFLVSHVLVPHGRFVLHGGAIGLGPGVVLTVGGTGSGKSTLAMAAIASGRPVLGDDLTVVRVSATGLEATGIPRPVAVPGDVAPAIEGATPVLADARARWELPPERLTPGWRPLVAIMTMGHNDRSNATLERLDETTAMRMSMSSFLSTFDPTLIRTFFPVAGTLARLPAWSFKHGADPSTRLTAAARCLDELAAAVQM